MACDRCGHEMQVGDFPFCKGNPADHRPGGYGVISDDIPGGLEIRHGLCNEDGSPRTYYSKSEIRTEEKRRGMVNYVRHRPPKGTDKSKHTSRWI